MRYSKIREMDVSNGEGLGVSLFVQGCHFHCRGCFNPETWDFSGGKEWTEEIKDTFIEIAGKPYIKRISILGGEPLCDENAPEVLEVINELKHLYPSKKIWLYTGYSFEDLYNKNVLSDNLAVNQILKVKHKIIESIDYLVDGQFQLENQDLYNEHIIWAGSTNQRIINVPATLSNSKIQLYNSKQEL